MLSVDDQRYVRLLAYRKANCITGPMLLYAFQLGLISEMCYAGDPVLQDHIPGSHIATPWTYKVSRW